MKLLHFSSWRIVAAMLALGVAPLINSASAFQRSPTAAEGGVEILTRGPVHEAFAETIAFDPEPGLIAPKAPPEAIEEVPPEQRPEGTNVAWIPGYWAWDDERTDFLWVSGIWRALPPGRQWVPGYWGRANRGAQWTSGYWADAKATEAEYLPEPPATVEVGPNIKAPSADHTWLPGVWLWQQNRYAWRPGYWAAGQSDWDWVPAHYVWTPRGYVFVDGYYDYSVARRGVIFAPVYFNSGIYTQRGYSYSPTTVINPAVFASNLFLRPSYGHYYFGDYYGSNYANRGYSSWITFQSSRSGYDPFYAQQRWTNRNNQQWTRQVQADYQNRHDNEAARPPRTWEDQQARAARDLTNKEQSFVVAAPLADVVKSKDGAVRYQALAKEERQQLSQRGQDFRAAREERQELEAAAVDTTPDAPARSTQPYRAKLPKTPIDAQPIDRPGRVEAPPPAIEAPQPDAKIEPQPRKPRVDAGTPRVDPNVPRVEPKPLPPKEKPLVEPKPIPRVEPKPAPKVEPKPAPKVEPRPIPRVEPKPAPKVEPRPTPKVEPKPPQPQPPQPQPQPKPERPKVEPKPTPRVEPKQPQPPQPQPMPGPAGPPKSEGKKK